jgi:hypothetical protein
MGVHDLFPSRTGVRGGRGTRGVDDGAGLDLSASRILDDLHGLCQCGMPARLERGRLVGNQRAAAAHQVVNENDAYGMPRRNARRERREPRRSDTVSLPAILRI